MSRRERGKAGLSLLEGEVVGQGAPPPLRGGVVVLLDHPLPVPRPWPAGDHGHGVVLRERREHRREVTRAGLEHRGHPIEPPVACHATQQRQNRRECGEQVRQIHRRGDRRPPHPGVREGPDQHECLLRGEPPPRGRVGQLDPVELGLLPRWMLDDRVRPLRDMRARDARRPQPAITDLPSQRLIRPRIAERDQLVPKRDRPQMRVLDQSGGHVADERGERVRTRACSHPRGAFPGQVRPDRLTVMAGAAGDLTDRHPLPFERVDIHVVLL